MIVVIDQYIEYSPYFQRYSSFAKKVEVHIDLDECLLSNYMDFLYGREFTMNEEDGVLLDFMGHPNESLYPLDYWKLKLRSIWIRDNFYKLKLYENPLYGLSEVEKFVEILPFGDTLDSGESGMVIAGGSALYMTGMVDKCEDVDLFSIDKEKSMTYFEERCIRAQSKVDSYHLDVWASTGLNSYDITMGIKERRYSICNNALELHSIYKKISLIRRSYTCPSEIVHGFDIDCCQFIIVDGVLYGTELALYSIKRKCNWIDMRWNSPTYIRRLAKYHSRGICLRLPLLTMDAVTINTKHLQWLSYCNHQAAMSISNLSDRIRGMGIATDPASILIYISFFNITYTILLRMLTGQKEDEPYSYDSVVVNKFVWDSHWIDVDPIQQVSSNLYPEYSDIIVDLYLRSPLVDEDIKKVIRTIQ